MADGVSSEGCAIVNVFGFADEMGKGVANEASWPDMGAASKGREADTEAAGSGADREGKAVALEGV